MSTSVLYQTIGYIGSALIVLSLTMKSLLKLRLIGLAGAVVFTAYGLLIEAYPVAGVSAVIVFVHLIFLRDLVSKKKEYFTILHVTKDSVYLQYFLDYHRDEIRHSVPGFAYTPADDQITVFILRDLVPAGLFIWGFSEHNSLEVVLDFVIPMYRDFKIGEFLYSQRSGVFADPRCQCAWSVGGTKDYNDYLERMGFIPAVGADSRPIYSLDLSALNEPAER